MQKLEEISLNNQCVGNQAMNLLTSCAIPSNGFVRVGFPAYRVPTSRLFRMKSTLPDILIVNCQTVASKGCATCIRRSIAISVSRSKKALPPITRNCDASVELTRFQSTPLLHQQAKIQGRHIVQSSSLLIPVSI